MCPQLGGRVGGRGGQEGLLPDGDETPAAKPKRKSPGKGPPAWRRTGDSPGKNFLPAEKVAKKEVDLDLIFRRAEQFVEYMMDRMETEINGSDGFEGVPAKFGSQLRDLSSALNTLSLSHARWLKANEEMYERLSDDEKLAALKAYIPALYLRHPQIVKDWMRDVALAIQETNKSRPVPKGGVLHESAVEEVVGPLPRRPEWKTIQAQVRADFAKKRQAAFGNPVRDVDGSRATNKIWTGRNKESANDADSGE